MQDRNFASGYETTNGAVHDDYDDIDPFARQDPSEPFPATKGAILFINLFFQGLVFAGLDMFEALGENEFSVHVLTSLQKCEMAVEALLAQTTNVANLTAVTLAQPKIANGFTGTS
jgi:hypothetical protein